MKTYILLASLLGTASLAFASNDTSMPGCCNATPSTVAQASSAATPAYPLDTCVVSGEKLGEMGAPVDYIYKAEGKPDRLVRFCCTKCVAKFKNDPAKYLKVLDEAANKTPTSTGAEHAHT
jgi:YHS domain-containing protein